VLASLGDYADDAERGGIYIRDMFHVSPRQGEILELVATGLPDKAIAVRLGVSRRTVEAHLQRLYDEHGLHTRAAVVAAWLRNSPLPT
jgi:DNA-binding CsgD family transcriptional regulator